MRITTNTGRTASGSGLTLCNSAYIMISAYWAAPAAAEKLLKFSVTQRTFAKTLEESIPMRPIAVTKPVDGPATGSGA